MKISILPKKACPKWALWISVCIFLMIANTSGAAALLQAGAPAPAFSLNDMEGKEVSLSQYSQNKAVVLLFWATWSAKSPNALKRFEDFHRKYGQKGIVIIGINADNQTLSAEDATKIKGLLASHGITFPVLLDKGLKTFHEYEVIALPSTVVIMEGKIAYELAGFPLTGTENLFDYLLSLAGETPRGNKVTGGYKPKYDAIADTNLAKGFVKKGKYAMAYPLFMKAIAKDPSYMAPYIDLARLYALEGKTKEVEDTLRSALKMAPENIVVLAELGYLLTNTNRAGESVELLAGYAKDGAYTPALYYYAYALAAAGRLNDALAAFDNALQLNPFDPVTYRLRGEVYENNRMMKEASSEYRRSLELLLKMSK